MCKKPEESACVLSIQFSDSLGPSANKSMSDLIKNEISTVRYVWIDYRVQNLMVEVSLEEIRHPRPWAHERRWPLILTVSYANRILKENGQQLLPVHVTISQFPSATRKESPFWYSLSIFIFSYWVKLWVNYI